MSISGLIHVIKNAIEVNWWRRYGNIKSYCDGMMWVFTNDELYCPDDIKYCILITLSHREPPSSPSSRHSPMHQIIAWDNLINIFPNVVLLLFTR